MELGCARWAGEAGCCTRVNGDKCDVGDVEGGGVRRSSDGGAGGDGGGGSSESK